VSLLVLSAPDVLHHADGGAVIHIPEELQPLVDENTFVLLNKRDLLPHALSAPRQDGWLISLTEEQGTGEFMCGFADALRKKYDCILPNARTKAHSNVQIRHDTRDRGP